MTAKDVTAKDVVVGLLSLNGSTLTHQTRFQREVYLLNHCGAEFGFSFYYHDYSPYSSDLVEGWIEARKEKKIEIKEAVDSDGFSYMTFSLCSEKGTISSLGKLDKEKAISLLDEMNRASGIVLELAADIAYLKEKGYGQQKAINELKIRKPFITRKGRLTAANTFLKKLTSVSK